MIEIDAQNSGNGISGVQISKNFRGDAAGPLIMRGFGVRHGQGFRLDQRLRTASVLDVLHAGEFFCRIKRFEGKNSRFEVLVPTDRRSGIVCLYRVYRVLIAAATI